MNIIKLPGLIDPHVHFRTPGQMKKEDFKTGTAAALAGGYTMVIDMPNNKTPITTDKLLDEKMDAAINNILCDVGFHFGSLGDNFDEFEKMAGKVFGLKLYLNETTGNFLIDKKTLSSIFEAWPHDAGPILVHAEDDAVDAAIKNADKYMKRVHFCHISLKSDLEKIMEAKEKGIRVTCGVTPHHLFLTQSDVMKLGPFARMKPFLKSQKDVDFLWLNMKSIDLIESDHAPHTKKEKESKQPPFGVPGLETTLPLLLNAVNEGRMEVSDIQRLCYTNPKMIFSLPDQDSTVTVDMDEKYEIKNRHLYTKCGWSPFDGWKLKGRIKKVSLRSKVVFENGKVTAEKGYGELITPIKL